MSPTWPGRGQPSVTPPPRSGIHRVRPCGLLQMGSAAAMPGPPAGKGPPEAAGAAPAQAPDKQWPKCSPHGVRAPASRSCWVTDGPPKLLGSSPLQFPSTWPPHCTHRPYALGQGRTHCPLPLPSRCTPSSSLWFQVLSKAGSTGHGLPPASMCRGTSRGQQWGPHTHKHTHSPVRVRGQGFGARGRWAGGGHSSVWSGLNVNRAPIPPTPTPGDGGTGLQ